MAVKQDYNPSVKDPIPGVYRLWYVVVTILSILTGAALIAMGITMKVLDGNLSWLICHIWTGIPLFVGGFIAIVPCATRSRRYAMFYLFFMFVCMVLCATGAIISGLEYWMSYWQETKIAMDRGKCSVSNGLCQCTSVFNNLNLPVTASVANCDDLESIVGLMISTIAINALGFIVSTMAVFVAFMSICCGPWVYLSSYSKEQDPDFHCVVPVVHTSTINKGYR